MESRVTLALATKLRRIFEDDSTYLSFPLGVGFTNQYLGFMKEPESSGLSLQAQLNVKADFARLLNIVPEDSVAFAQDASRLLWDRLIDVLEASRFAKSALTAAEEQQLERAIDLLTDWVELDDGTSIPVNSPRVTRYYEYKTLYDQAEATYLDEKMTVELTVGSEGDALRKEWTAYREKQLLDAKQKAESDWNNLGSRQEVQDAQRIRNDLEPRSYLNLYRAAYLNDISISEVPDLNGMGIGIYPTFFSPFDVFEPDVPWSRITLTRAEVDALVKSAPADLRRLFGAESGGDDLVSVSLEYSNVVVIRPWFRPELFASRYWRLDDGKVVSDGKRPRKGDIPAYITSMLVARNVAVTRRKAADAKPKKPLSASFISASTLDRPLAPAASLVAAKKKLRLRSVLADMPKLEIGDTAAASSRTSALTKSSFALPAGALQTKQLRGDLKVSSSASRPMVAAAAAALRTPAASASIGKLAAARTPAASASVGKISAVKLPPLSASVGNVARLKSAESRVLGRDPKAPAAYALAKYHGTTISTPRKKLVVARAAIASTTDTVVERQALSGVVVLAFVCKRVPISPHPDPSIEW
jgi:hypothetical protein